MIVIVLLAAMIVILTAGYALTRQTSQDLSQPRQNLDGGVTVTATYMGNNTFSVKLDTHSGSLADLGNVSYVQDSKGIVYRPVSWSGGAGGHHLGGALTFPKFDDTGDFKLVVNDIGGMKERVLEW
jgi:hypothetical protein